ncbi:MAG: hypothetical protein PHF74_07320 [Dehalococcoidales bacterium]|nr:hypothetical protein [Dehalococcoidales bacterium]
MNNRRKILDMLADNKITTEEAERLLSLLGDEKEETETKDTKSVNPLKNLKYLRVVVKTIPNPEYQPANGNLFSNDDDDDDNVNIRVPMSLIRAGMKLTSIIPPAAYNQMDSSLKEKGIDFDLRNIKPENVEELISALGDLEVNVESKNKRKNTTVRVYAE